jgi:hypothetical protein
MTYTVYIVGSIRARTVVQSTDVSKVEHLIVQELYNKMAENGTKQQVFYTITDAHVKASGTVKWGHASDIESGCVIEHGTWYKDDKPSDFAMERYTYYSGRIHSISHSMIQ